MFHSAYESKGFCRFTTNPEMKTINNKNAAVVQAAFNIGTTQKPETLFAELTFWGNDAESVMQYPKGHLFYIEGPTKYNAYIKNGNAEGKANIKVTKWRSLEKNNAQNNGNYQQGQGQQPPQNSGNYNNQQTPQNGNYAPQNSQYQQQQYSQQYPQAPEPANNRQTTQYQPNNVPPQNIPPQNIPPQNVPPQNIPPQRSNNTPPTRGNGQYQQAEFYAQGGMPYPNSPQFTPDGDLDFSKA